MNLIQKKGSRYRLSNPLLLQFTAAFIVWQMGVLFYSGTAMSLFGRTPIVLTQSVTMAVIAAGYIFSILFMCFLPKQTVWAERSLMPIALLASVLTLLRLPSSCIEALFYIEAFVCTFSIGTMVSVAVNQFTMDTIWRDGIIGMIAGGTLTALLQNEIYQVSFTAFAVFSVLLIAMQTIFYYYIPAVTEVRYVSRENKIKMPKILFIGFWTINAVSTLLMCMASSFAESVPHGISLLYLSAAVAASVLYLSRRKLKERSIRTYSVFFAMSVLGFVFAYLSLRIPALRYPSLILLGFIAVLAVIWIFFAASSFQEYPTRFIGVIAAGMGLVIAAFHSKLQELLRDDLPLLYGIYAALSVVLLVIYFLMEPYFVYAWSKNNTQERERDENQVESVTLPGNEAKKKSNPFDILSEQESVLAQLILGGHTESSAAKTMNITLNTEKGYRKSLYFKLDIHSKRELFEIAKEALI